MGRVPPLLRRTAAGLAMLAAASCSAPPAGAPLSAQHGAGSHGSAAPGAGPLTAEINQFRDNYSKQIIEIQLTNTTAEALTVLAAVVDSPLFSSGIRWSSPGPGIELPPGQTKSLPAQLPPASCAGTQGSPAAEPAAAVTVRLAPAAGARASGPAATTPADPGSAVTATAADPFGVLVRNNAELCLAQAAAGVAGFRFNPDLEVAPDGRSAVLGLVITPRYGASTAAGSGGGSGGPAGSLIIESVGGTTLLEEDAGAPWPVNLRVDAFGPERTLRLGIRPARCDPHAVAEDKVGTLIPLRASTAGREGVLKVDAGTRLRGRIYDFVTNACGRQ